VWWEELTGGGWSLRAGWLRPCRRPVGFGPGLGVGREYWSARDGQRLYYQPWPGPLSAVSTPSVTWRKRFTAERRAALVDKRAWAGSEIIPLTPRPQQCHVRYPASGYTLLSL